MTERGQVKNGVGSYKLKSGATRYRVIYRANGKVIEKGGFKTKGAAQAFVNQAKVSVDTGTHVAPAGGRKNFTKWVETWSASVIDVRESTSVRDQNYLKLYVVPTFGPMALRQIDHTAVAEWVADISRSGKKNGDPLAPATVHKAYQVMSKVMRAAVLAGLIQRNPCTDVPLPKDDRDERRFLTPDELISLEVALAVTDERYALIVPFLADTGLRIGELAALRYRDLDIPAGTVSITQNLVEVNGSRAVIGAPKTKAGRRTVPTLTPEVGARLAVRAVALGHGPDDYVFGGPMGGPLRPNNFRRRVWKPAVVLAGLEAPQPTPHALRHTAITLWISAGVTNRLKLARWAGHQSVSMIDKVYGHLLPDDSAEERQMLSNLRAEATAKRREKVQPEPVAKRHLRIVS